MSTPLPRSNGAAREFVFTGEDFERVRALIYARAGIALSDSKRDMVYSRLARRLRATGMPSFDAYLALIDAGDPAELQEFTNALTTNLTSFFREPHHFPLLAEHLLARHREEPGRVLKIWCCAASTGEEPYSIAMTAIEAFGTDTPPVRILATDIDTNVLETAAAGVYAEDRIATLEDERKRRFFQRGTGPNQGRVRVRAPLRALLSFRPLNLLGGDWSVKGPLDVIFCRNVMIYFDKATQLTILERFTPLLRYDGLLFAGHSESFHNAGHLIRLRGKTVYSRVDRRTGA